MKYEKTCGRPLAEGGYIKHPERVLVPVGYEKTFPDKVLKIEGDLSDVKIVRVRGNNVEVFEPDEHEETIHVAIRKMQVLDNLGLVVTGNNIQKHQYSETCAPAKVKKRTVKVNRAKLET